MGYRNNDVTSAEQLNKFIQRADCCKIIYFGNNKETFARIQEVAAAQEDRCCAWLKQKSLLQSLISPSETPGESMARMLCKNGTHKEWLKAADLEDKASIGMAYDECNRNC
jgi:dihydroxyacetone kinase-like predicted kinase